MAYYAKTVVVDMTPMTEEPEFSILSLRQLEEISGQYRCVICLRDPHDAHICPKCTQIFGKGCLYTAYNVFDATSCPHCG